MADEGGRRARYDGSLSRRRLLQSVGMGGAVAVAGCLGGGGGGAPCKDLRRDLSTGTTNATPDAFGTPDSDWQVVSSPDGTTGAAVSIQPVGQWVTVPSANWIDPYGSGGWPATVDPVGEYVYETTFEVTDDWSDGQCELRIEAWSVDDSAVLELDGPGGTTTLDQGAGHQTLKGPVTQAVGPGQYTLRAVVQNNLTVSGLLVDAELFCDCDATGSDEPCDLSVTKEHTGGPVSYGGQADFELTVCNDGQSDCDPGTVTVTDDLPPGTSFASSAGSGWTCTESGGVVTCEHANAGGLAPGDCLPTLTLTVDVGGPDEVGDVLLNCATVEQGDPDLPHKRDCVEVAVEPPATACDLAVEKRHDGEAVTPGDTTTFQIEVCNVGDRRCRGLVSVVDDLPAGTSFVSGSGTGWTCAASGGVVTCDHLNAGGLAAGDCLPVLTLTVQVGSMDETGDLLRNCARLDFDDENALNDRDCVEVPVGTGGGDGKCDLAVEKRHDGEAVVPGDTTTFQIEVCNVGDGDCTDPVTVVDDLPAGTSFDAGSGTGWTCTPSAGSVVCEHPNAGGLAPGDCLPVLTLTVQVGSMDETGDQLRNCAYVEGTDANPENDRDCVAVPVDSSGGGGKCDLAIEKRHDGEPVAEGTTTTFELEVCNVGDGDCVDPVTVVDDLPAGVSYDAASGNGWTCTTSGGSVVCEHPNAGGLAPGDCLPVVTLSVQVGSVAETGDRFRNCAFIEGTDANPENDRDCVDVPVEQAAGGCEGLSITKATAGQFTYGSQHSYVVDVCNDGDLACEGRVTVTDDLPDGMSFVAVSGSGWSGSASGGVVTATHANAGGLAPGDCLPTLTLTVSLVPANQWPTGSDAVQNCAQLLVDGAPVDTGCVTHVVHNT